MEKYKIVVYGSGLLVNAKKINLEKMKFWSKKKTSELTRYLFDGDDDFDNFTVPSNAKISGILAEHEEDLEIQWTHENFSERKIEQIYGPKLDAIERIEVFSISGDDKLVWKEDKPSIKNYIHPDEDDEDLGVYIKIEKNNLIILESEKGHWTFECEAAFEEKMTPCEISSISTNCSFGEPLDEIIDGVCVAFLINEKIFWLIDAETETMGRFATVYKDN